jgi:hypothetical protein
MTKKFQNQPALFTWEQSGNTVDPDRTAFLSQFGDDFHLAFCAGIISFRLGDAPHIAAQLRVAVNLLDGIKDGS